MATAAASIGFSSGAKQRPIRHALVCAILLSFSGTSGAGEIVPAERAWNRRAEELNGRLARSERIEEAIGAYRAASESESEPLEARWKRLRALHYLIEFTDAPEERKERAVEQAVSLAKAWVDDLAEGEGDLRDRALLYFWSAIVWGARGQRVGLLTIVREGVARRIYDHASRAVALDPEIEDGGGYRLLSRLHAEVPRVPFISGWVDRRQTLPLAEQGFAIDPEHPGNRVILALALLERAPDRKAEAVELLESVSRSDPQPAFLAEDLAIRERARERLEELAGDSEFRD